MHSPKRCSFDVLENKKQHYSNICRIDHFWIFEFKDEVMDKIPVLLHPHLCFKSLGGGTKTFLEFRSITNSYRFYYRPERFCSINNLKFLSLNIVYSANYKLPVTELIQNVGPLSSAIGNVYHLHWSFYACHMCCVLNLYNLYTITAHCFRCY